jgi:hypothetical protein
MHTSISLGAALTSHNSAAAALRPLDALLYNWVISISLHTSELSTISTTHLMVWFVANRMMNHQMIVLHRSVDISSSEQAAVSQLTYRVVCPTT